jgi:hypothetical protein
MPVEVEALKELVSKIERNCDASEDDHLVYNALVRVLANFIVANQQSVAKTAEDLAGVVAILARNAPAPDDAVSLH